jgi:type IV pilus assembly protein PilC
MNNVDRSVMMDIKRSVFSGEAYHGGDNTLEWLKPKLEDAIVKEIKDYYIMARREGDGLLIDKIMIRMPVFGNIIRKNAVAKFTRTLGTLVAAGVPILDGLDIVAKSAGNKVIENAVVHVKEKSAEGRSMAEPLAQVGVFPPMVVQMIGVGEATGAMDTMLNKIADFYEEEVDVAVDAFTAMLEPIMMVFIGGIVGGLLIAMYLPIFSLADNIGTD